MTAIGEMKIKKVLLIDDNETDLFICKRILEMSDANKEISTFTSAEDALSFQKPALLTSCRILFFWTSTCQE